MKMFTGLSWVRILWKSGVREFQILRNSAELETLLVSGSILENLLELVFELPKILNEERDMRLKRFVDSQSLVDHDANYGHF